VLHDVFGENDAARRRAAVGEIFTEDCVFDEPNGVYRGRGEIDRVAGAIKATHMPQCSRLTQGAICSRLKVTAWVGVVVERQGGGAE
jgi:hypothetical protein